MRSVSKPRVGKEHLVAQLRQCVAIHAPTPRQARENSGSHPTSWHHLRARHVREADLHFYSNIYHDWSPEQGAS